MFRLSELQTLLIFTCLQTITMAPYARWVLPSFRTILVNRCDDYLNSSDRGTDKGRSKLITEVAKDITDIAQENGENIPDDLEKVIFQHIQRMTSINRCF